MDHDSEEQTRAVAYEIWENEGRPEGLHEVHWAQAEQWLAEAREEEAARHPTPAAGRPPT